MYPQTRMPGHHQHLGFLKLHDGLVASRVSMYHERGTGEIQFFTLML